MTGIVDIAVAIVVVAVLGVVVIFDLRRRIVPNRIVVSAAVLVLAVRTATHPSVVWIAAGAGAALFFFVPAVVRPGAMGMGDVKLALLLGVAAGRWVPLALLIALAAASVPGVVLVVRHGLRARTMAIPFAPFLALGGVVALAVQI